MKKIVSCILCLTLVVTTAFGISTPVMAKEMSNYEDDDVLSDAVYSESGSEKIVWKDDFEYHTDGDTIILERYKGHASSLHIPATAMINGDLYNVKLKDECYRFIGGDYIESVSFDSALDTSNVTSMYEMFALCHNLKYVDLSSLDTSNVSSMREMFWDCKSLTNIDLSPLNTSNVTDMSGMFADCENLTTVDLSPLDTSNVTSMTNMFNGCYNLTNIDLSPLDTSNVAYMEAMFEDCQSLTSIDLSPLDTSKVQSMYAMFSGCSNLRTVNINSNDIHNVEGMEFMFSGCNSLQDIDLSRLDLGNVKKAYGMLDRCIRLEKIHIPLGVQVEVELPYTFVDENNKSIEYNALPLNRTSSYTIVKQEDTRDNVISINESAGTAVVWDAVKGDTRTVPLEYIRAGLVYRMYDPHRGEHFYTKNSSEMQELVRRGWIHEEDADFSVADATDSDAIPVYRLYNRNGGGMHFYTENPLEVKQLSMFWVYEGISHYVYKKTSNQGMEQYRLYNPYSSNGEHNWTSNVEERDMLVSLGWRDEGMCWKIK